jgi:hypothetical protein
MYAQIYGPCAPAWERGEGDQGHRRLQSAQMGRSSPPARPRGYTTRGHRERARITMGRWEEEAPLLFLEARPICRWIRSVGTARCESSRCMEPAFAVAALALCASSVNRMVARLRSHSRCVYSCILSLSIQPHCNGVIGAEGNIDGHACGSCIINAWRTRRKLGTLPFQSTRLRLFPVPSVLSIVSRGESCPLAIHVPVWLERCRSDCLAFQQAWGFLSVWSSRKTVPSYSCALLARDISRRSASQ